LFRSDARAKLLRGAGALADAIRITLGPRSKSVLIAKKWGPPIVCNDGVTISRELELKDLEEDLGVRMIREVAERTGDAVGAGTSTSTLLAHAIYAEGVRNVEAGASAVDLKRGRLDRGLRAAVAAIQRISRPVASKREKEQIATISAHNDEQIGKLVADAVERVGSDGFPGGPRATTAPRRAARRTGCATRSRKTSDPDRAAPPGRGQWGSIGITGCDRCAPGRCSRAGSGRGR
jgi:chaperonin GroEL